MLDAKKTPPSKGGVWGSGTLLNQDLEPSSFFSVSDLSLHGQQPPSAAWTEAREMKARPVRVRRILFIFCHLSGGSGGVKGRAKGFSDPWGRGLQRAAFAIWV